MEVVDKCYYCGADLTQKEYKEWANSEMCCGGRDCGCRGMPINPPICDKCIIMLTTRLYDN